MKTPPTEEHVILQSIHSRPLELRSSWYHQKLNIFDKEKISSGQSPQIRPRGRPKQQCLPAFDMNHGTLLSDTVQSSNKPDSRHPSYRVVGTARVKPDQLSGLNANKLGGLNKASPVKSAELIVCKCGIRKCIKSWASYGVFAWKRHSVRHSVFLVVIEISKKSIGAWKFHALKLNSCYVSVSQ